MKIKEIKILVECEECTDGWVQDYGDTYKCGECDGTGKKEHTFVLKEEEE